MPKDKPDALKVKKSEVKPVELPEKGTQFGPPGSKDAPDTRPRHERRRDHKAEQKKKKKILGAIKKQQQESRRPLRRGDMQLIVSNVFGQLRPLVQGIQDHLDKLDYLPDYIADVLDGERECSIADFDEWFKELKEQLEAEESPGEEGEPVEGQAMAAQSEEEQGDSPTEETQED